MRNALIDPDFWRAANLEDVRERLDVGDDPNAVCSTGSNRAGTIIDPLWTAFHQLGMDGFRLLLDRGADPQSRLSYVYSHVGVGYSEDVVRLLLDRGADPNELNSKGRPALFDWFASSDDSIARLLIEAGADVNAIAIHNGVPLLLSLARENKWACIPLLLEYGMDVFATDSAGWTLLHYAAHAKEWDIARILLERGADPDAEGEWGKTPRILAELKGVNLDDLPS